MNVAGRLANGALLFLPGALTIYLGFDAGGFFPDSVAVATLLLVAVLALRAALAESPFEGIGVRLLVAAGALAAFGLWTLLSGRWGLHAPGRALIEFDRVLLYLLALVLFGTIARRSSNLRWMLRGLALGIVAICVTGLATRLLPDVFPVAETLANDRLSYPVTYWNALGLLAAVGALICFHVASSLTEPRAMRVAGAGAVPLLVTTVYFTFSRGAIVAGIVGLLAYVALGRPRGFLSGALACVPATVIAVVFAYDADLLATENPTTTAAADQGQEVLIALACCVAGAALVRGLALLLDDRLARDGILNRLPRRPLAWSSVTAAVAAVAILVAIGVPGEIGDQYDRFVQNQGPGGTGGDLRTRFTDPSNNGRIDTWSAAADEFTARPVLGSGAGTFQNVWAVNREIAFSVQDAHSLYVEVLSELGIVGLVLFIAVLLTVLVTLILRSIRGDRTLYAVLFAAVLTWAVHAGVDWDWEMPAVTLWVFALGGAALAASPREPRAQLPGTVPRVAAVIACAGLAVVPGLVLASQTRLDDAADAYERGDCATAVADANDAISVLSVRAEPYEIRGFCRLRENRPKAAIADFEKALDRDPANWIYFYDLTLAKAAAGEPAAGQAVVTLAYNPLDEEANDLVRRLVTRDERRQRRETRRLLAGANPFYLSTRGR